MRGARLVRSNTVLFVVLACLVAVCSVVLPTASARADATTNSVDASRDGWDPREPGLVPASVSGADFGRLWARTLPAVTGTTANQVYAQPVVADGQVFVVTEENQVDALDPATGALIRSVNLGPSWPAATIGCGDLTPDIGSTSTPVYDPATDTLYLTTKTNDGADATQPNWRLHALDPATLTDRVGWPVTIAGKPSNGGAAFNARTAMQRPGLLLLGGTVYIGFASHCDYSPYVGYVAGVNTTSRAVTLWATETQNSQAGAGIWQSGAGLVSDGPGRIFVATGNGVSPPPGPGTAPPGTLAESVVRLGVQPDGSLAAQDYFSPYNNQKLDSWDADLGSGGPVALPDSFGTPSHPHVLAIVGKTGILYLLDRDDLGGTAQGVNGSDRVLSSTSVGAGVWGRVAAFAARTGSTTTNYLYVTPNGRPMQVYAVSADANGIPRLAQVAQGADTFGYTSGSPVVTSNGQDGSSALVWAVQSPDRSGVGGALIAYDAVPGSGSLHQRFSATLGTVSKFSQPATDSGRVFVATRDGVVYGFGQPTTSPLSGAPVDLGTVPVGSTSAAQNLVLTAHQDLAISDIEVSDPFNEVDGSAQTVNLSSGQTLSVPVTVSPTAAGVVHGTVTVNTNAESFHYDLHAVGSAPGLSADPATLQFGEVATGVTRHLGLVLTNTDTVAETVTAVTLPTNPAFTVSGLPTVDSTLQGQQPVTVDVAFRSLSGGPVSDNLTIQMSAGPPLVVPLSAIGTVGAARMDVSQSSLAFGQVPPGRTASLTFTITNAGSVGLTITKAAPPTAPFSVLAAVNEGQTLDPGDSITQTVTVAPTSAQPVTGVFSITADDGLGARQIAMTVNDQHWTGPIRTAVGTCLDLAGGGSGPGVNGTRATSTSCRPTAGQQLTQPGDGSVRALGKCLDVRNGGTSRGTAVQLWTCNGTGAQQWTWRADQSLYNPQSRLCLDIPYGSSTPGTALQLWSCNRAAAQRFDLAALTAARGQVQNPNKLCLDDRYGSSVDGAVIQQWTCNLTAAQIVAVPGSGSVQINGKCLDVRYGVLTRGTPVQLWTCNGTGAQLWRSTSTGQLVNVPSGLCLDVPGNSAAVGVGLQVWTCNGSNAQRWPVPA